MTEKQKQKWKSFAQFKRKSNKNKFIRMSVYFSDEKNFIIQEGHNRNNRVIYSDSNKNALKNG